MNIWFPLFWSTWSREARTQPYMLAWSMGSDYSICIASKHKCLKRFGHCFSFTSRKYWKTVAHADGFSTLSDIPSLVSPPSSSPPSKGAHNVAWFCFWVCCTGPGSVPPTPASTTALATGQTLAAGLNGCWCSPLPAPLWCCTDASATNLRAHKKEKYL